MQPYIPKPVFHHEAHETFGVSISGKALHRALPLKTHGLTFLRRKIKQLNLVEGVDFTVAPRDVHLTLLAAIKITASAQVSLPELQNLYDSYCQRTLIDMKALYKYLLDTQQVHNAVQFTVVDQLHRIQGDRTKNAIEKSVEISAVTAGRDGLLNAELNDRRRMLEAVSRAAAAMNSICPVPKA